MKLAILENIRVIAYLTVTLMIIICYIAIFAVIILHVFILDPGFSVLDVIAWASLFSLLITLAILNILKARIQKWDTQNKNQIKTTDNS